MEASSADFGRRRRVEGEEEKGSGECSGPRM